MLDTPNFVSMAYFALSIDAPTLSAYDPDNPTQATEELNIQLHNIIQDMEDAGFYLSDNVPSTADRTTILGYMRGNIQAVYTYAKNAISSFRSTGDPDISAPTTGLLTAPTLVQHFIFQREQLEIYLQCWKALWVIYYLWDSEEDPLRIKDYIRDMLLAWPLQDIQINLADDSGSQMKIFPAWRGLEQ